MEYLQLFDASTKAVLRLGHEPPNIIHIGQSLYMTSYAVVSPICRINNYRRGTATCTALQHNHNIRTLSLTSIVAPFSNKISIAGTLSTIAPYQRAVLPS